MGPNGDGTSSEKGLPRAWPAAGPKVLWTMKLGPGYGGAAIHNGQVFLMDRADEKQDILRCLDLATGKEEWTYSYEAPGRISHDGSRSTPAVNDKRVFIIGPFGHFFCLDRVTHQVLWHKNLLAEFATKLPTWAVSQSPLLYRDLVIVAPQGGDVGIMALEQETGRERWRSPAVGNLAYASPKLINLDGIDQFTIVTPSGVAAVDAAEGKKLWEYPHPCKIPIPNVSFLAGNKLFVTGGYNAGSAIIQVTQEGGKWTVKQLTQIEKMGGHCHPALVYQDHLYVLCNTNERADGLVCLDANGKVVWQTSRNPYLCKGGSLLTADGLMYVMDGEKGELHIVEPSPAGFKSLSKAKLLEGREIWGPLALADGKMVIRDQSQVKCLDLKAP
jgi:outer membrane protein assembly factor BamB